MTILDRYIARQYILNVVALLVLLCSFVVTVDVALNIDKFLDRADALIQAHAKAAPPPAAGQPAPPPSKPGTIRRLTLASLLVFDLWWPRLLQLYTYLIGLVIVAAMGFTFTQLVRHREMVAVLAGGISLYRIAWPVILVAAGFYALKVIDQECILSRPDIRPLLARDHDKAGERDWSDFALLPTDDTQGRLFMARKFEPSTGVLTDLIVWLRDSHGLAQSTITADKAIWKNGAWQLTNPHAQSIQLMSSTSPEAAEHRQLPAPHELKTNLDPATLKFKRFAAFSQTLSWSQIGEMLTRPMSPDVRAKLQRTRWSRVSQVLSGVLALIITMPLFLVREPKNMLIQSLKAAPVGLVSLLGGILLSLAPWPGLPAGFAVFIPVLILIPVAVVMVSWVKT